MQASEQKTVLNYLMSFNRVLYTFMEGFFIFSFFYLTQFLRLTPE